MTDSTEVNKIKLEIWKQFQRGSAPNSIDSSFEDADLHL